MLKLGRSALLEPLMVLFVVVALLLCWHWVERGRTWDALLTGAALGAAMAAKPTAGLLAPVLAVAAVAALGPSRRTLVQVLALGLGALGLVAASYLPLGGEAPEAFRSMVEFQTQEHVAAGHQVIVAGEVFDRAPWWAYGWWQWRSVGSVALLALALAGVAGALLSPRRWVVGLLGASLLWPLAYLSLAAGFGLPHYLHLWQPVLVLLAAVGLAELARRPGPARLGAGVLVVALTVVGAQTLWAIATTERLGYGAVGDLLDERVLVGQAVVVWGQTLVAEHELPGAQVVRSPEEATLPVLAVIVDPGTVARDPRPEVEAFLAAEGDGFERREVDHLTLHLRR
jgi:4-amino-4-deoxy-L-arabinose transferase-like glycosyltransferase